MNKDYGIKIIQLLFLVGLLILIRAFENQLFYDPFLDYFKLESNSVYPKFEALQLYGNFFLRYFFNSIISITILYLIFKEVSLVYFAAFLYTVFFVILIVLFYFFINYFDESQKLTLFYIRRFIIQPVFILLFIPGFYFQKQSEKK